jgi:hypothetical protein
MGDEIQESCLDNIQNTRGSQYAGIKEINIPAPDLIPNFKVGIARIIERYTFEMNDRQTREDLVFDIDNFLEDAYNIRDIHDFGVVCDETNNIAETVDKGELRVDVTIRQYEALEWVNLTYILRPEKIESEPDYITAYKRAMKVLD